MPLLLLAASFLAAQHPPRPPGRLIDIGGYRLHLHCTGRGSPPIVVEAGTGDFSFQWSAVQQELARHARICTYDRAGYAWSQPGAEPRTLDQLNLELLTLLTRSGETGPYILVGHSFGGNAVRNFALRYPRQVAGVVLADALHENQRVMVQGKPVRIREFASGRTLPAPRLEPGPAPSAAGWDPAAGLPPPLDRMAPQDQARQRWAQAQPALAAVSQSERSWSEEHLARWHAAGSRDSLGNLPLLVLTRAGEDASPLTAERLSLQAELPGLSRNGRQVVLRSGHNFHLEVPRQLAEAIRQWRSAIVKTP